MHVKQVAIIFLDKNKIEKNSADTSQFKLSFHLVDTQVLCSRNSDSLDGWPVTLTEHVINLSFPLIQINNTIKTAVLPINILIVNKPAAWFET